jgi:3-phenylpropionate/cinnamic acid dioxygenase small subunit
VTAASPFTTREGLRPASAEQYHAAMLFLVEEAELLDAARYRQWLELLTDDISYRMPVRVTAAHTLDDSFLPGMDHFREDHYSLEKRVQRFETDHAWTEDPPSRTRRFVTNFRVWSGKDDELVVKSYLLLFRSRGDVRQPDFVSAERVDVLRTVEGDLRLAERLIAVDESVLRTQNLAVFL